MCPFQQSGFAMVVLAGVLALVGCGGAAAPAAQANDKSNDKAPVTVQIVGKDLSFAPTTITTKAGQPVTLIFKNEGSLEHDWSILKIEVKDLQESAEDSHGSEGHNATMGGMDPDVHVAVEPGKTGQVTFTPTKAGTYEFLCTVQGHKQAGMQGTLVVQ